MIISYSISRTQVCKICMQYKVTQAKHVACSMLVEAPDILTNCLLIVISCLTDVVESGDTEAPNVIVPLERKINKLMITMMIVIIVIIIVIKTKVMGTRNSSH